MNFVLNAAFEVPVRGRSICSDAILCLPMQAGLDIALSGFVSLGHIKLQEIPDKVPVKERFEPQNNYRKIYDKMFKEFIQAYKSNRKLFARLNV